VDREAVALTVGTSRKRSSPRVLAHFVPGEKVTEFLAPEADWLEIRYRGDDDDTFYRDGGVLDEDALIAALPTGGLAAARPGQRGADKGRELANVVNR
jgi:hypothetical protein